MNDISFIVQIISKSKSTYTILGSGFIYSKEGIIVTCFHVIKNYINENLKIRFVFNNAEIILKANILSFNEIEDVAILKTIDIIDFEIIIPMVSQSIIPEKCELKTFGFPDIDEFDGIFSDGEFIGKVKENDKIRLQCRFEEVEKGFSGAPVWVKKTGEIIGLIYETTKPTDDFRNLKTTFIIPTSILLKVITSINDKALNIVKNPIINIAICKNSDILFNFSKGALKSLPIEIQEFRFEKSDGIESYLNFMHANPNDAKSLKSKILKDSTSIKEFAYWERISNYDIVFILYKASLVISEYYISLIKIAKKANKSLIVLLLYNESNSKYLIENWIERLKVENVNIIKVDESKKDLTLYILLNEYSHLLPSAKIEYLSESFSKFKEANY